jgi:hypothetical protein
MQTQPTQTRTFGITSTAELFCLRHWEVWDAWPYVFPLVHKALQSTVTPITTYEVLAALRERKAVLWGLRDGDQISAIWITQIEQNAEHKWGVVWIAAGEGLERGLEEFERFTEPYFKENGCEFIEVIGRKGWKKALTGFDEVGVRLIKRL